MQNPFGIAVRLRTSLKDEVTSSLERHAIKVRRHRPIGGTACILPIDDLGHPPQCLVHLFIIDNSVPQPVGNVLARYAQRGAVFHETDVMNVEYLGAAYPVVDPTYHVPKDALTIVI